MPMSDTFVCLTAGKLPQYRDLELTLPHGAAMIVKDFGMSASLWHRDQIQDVLIFAIDLTLVVAEALALNFLQIAIRHTNLNNSVVQRHRRRCEEDVLDLVAVP